MFWPFLFCCFFLAACSGEKNRLEPGICLSFDDNYVDDWYVLRPVFDQYKIRVTFFISGFNKLSPEQIVKLKKLQEDGHEIAYHGLTHAHAREYILENGYGAFFKTEIDSGLKLMKDAGFEISSFAYPFGSGFILTDFFLKDRFSVLRKAVAGKTVRVRKKAPFFIKRKRRTIKALDIDNNQPVSEDQLIEAMDLAKSEKRVLIVFAHKPVTEPKPGTYQVSISRLKKLITEAKKRKLKFYLTRELGEK